MNEVPFLIGVVGHRDLRPEEAPLIRAAISALLLRLRRDHPGAPLRLLSSLAAGTDLLAAEAGAELGIPLIALLPYAQELCRRDLECAEDRARFDRLCAAGEVVELDLPDGADPREVEHAGELRDLQYLRAGALIARYSGLLVAAWNGEGTTHRAGTARTVEFRRQGIVPGGAPIALPGDVLLSAQDDDVIFEIRCGRVSKPGHGVEVLGFTGGGGAPDGAEVPKSLRTTLARLAELNADLRRFGAEIDARARGLSGQGPAAACAELRQLDGLFAAADWMGSHFRRCFTLALKARYGLWALMAFLLIAFKKESTGRFAMVCILGVLAVFLCGTLLAVWAHRRAWHRKYLDYRALAEALRVDFYWEVAGLRKQFDGEFAHEGFLQQQDTELQWIRNAMRAVSLRLAAHPSGDFERGFPFVYADWIGDEAGGTGQLAYYRRRLHELEATLHGYERIDKALLLGGLVLAVTFAVDVASRAAGGSFLPGELRSTLLWGLALVPVYAAIFEIYLNEKADRALIRQYRYMSSLFGRAARELRLADSGERRLRILRSLGQACLAEHAQWILAHRDKRIQGMRLVRLGERRRVVALLVLLSAITYLDRVCISVAGPRMQRDLHLGPVEWGWVMGLFTLAYCLFEIPSGLLGDRLGPRRVLTRIVLWWSAFTALTGAATGLYPLALTRFLFGAGEAGAYPNSSIVISRWFPPARRATISGVVLMASQVGGALAPVLVVPIQSRYGWRASFYVFGALGLGWACAWWSTFRDFPGAPGAAGRPGEGGHAAFPWRRALRSRSFIALMCTAFCYVYVYNFFQTWFHTFLVEGRGFTETGLLLSTLPFAVAVLTNLAGGAVSDVLVTKFGLRGGRRAVGAAALAVAGTFALAAMVSKRSDVTLLCLTIVYAGITFQQPGVFGACLDIGGRHAGGVVALMNTTAQLGGLIGALAYGYIVEHSGSYDAPFVPMAAVLYAGALCWSRVDASRQICAPDPAGAPV